MAAKSIKAFVIQADRLDYECLLLYKANKLIKSPINYNILLKEKNVKSGHETTKKLLLILYNQSEKTIAF